MRQMGSTVAYWKMRTAPRVMSTYWLDELRLVIYFWTHNIWRSLNFNEISGEFKKKRRLIPQCYQHLLTSNCSSVAQLTVKSFTRDLTNLSRRSKFILDLGNSSSSSLFFFLGHFQRSSFNDVSGKIFPFMLGEAQSRSCAWHLTTLNLKDWKQKKSVDKWAFRGAVAPLFAVLFSATIFQHI